MPPSYGRQTSGRNATPGNASCIVFDAERLQDDPARRRLRRQRRRDRLVIDRLPVPAKGVGMSSPSRVTTIIGGLRTRWRRAEHEIRRRLTWSRLYRVTSYARSALWIVPFLSILAVLISVPILRVLDAWLEWDMMSLGVEGSKSLYQTVLTLNMSFLILSLIHI